jgi:hypothetical protein
MQFPKRLQFTDVIKAVRHNEVALATTIATNLAHNHLSILQRQLSPHLRNLRLVLTRCRHD